MRFVLYYVECVGVYVASLCVLRVCLCVECYVCIVVSYVVLYRIVCRCVLCALCVAHVVCCVLLCVACVVRIVLHCVCFVGLCVVCVVSCVCEFACGVCVVFVELPREYLVCILCRCDLCVLCVS